MSELRCPECHNEYATIPVCKYCGHKYEETKDSLLIPLIIIVIFMLAMAGLATLILLILDSKSSEVQWIVKSTDAIVQYFKMKAW